MPLRLTPTLKGKGAGRWSRNCYQGTDPIVVHAAGRAGSGWSMAMFVSVHKAAALAQSGREQLCSLSERAIWRFSSGMCPCLNSCFCVGTHWNCLTLPQQGKAHTQDLTTELGMETSRNPSSLGCTSRAQGVATRCPWFITPSPPEIDILLPFILAQ